ncbi:MAG: hypothetical protein CL450_09055 [Acidimicrobiaceae bacterium]|nr:hypothetical protein [Acidimicrobiaceae bacterium]
MFLFYAQRKKNLKFKLQNTTCAANSKMPFDAVMVRRQDGLAKQWTTTKFTNGYFTKPGVRMHYSVTYSLQSLDGSTKTLLVCEKKDVDIVETPPFIRRLPGLLRHQLFFGDLLFVVKQGNDYCPFTTDDLKSFLAGEHPTWSVRGIRDVSQQREVFEAHEISDEEEDEDEDDPGEEEDDGGDALDAALVEDEEVEQSDDEDDN